MAWMIDGNRLKEKAVSLLFPTNMESCGHLSDPVQAVTVSTIEDMVYREGVEVIPCKSCKCFMEYTKEHALSVEGADGDCYIRVMNSDDKQFCACKYDDFCSYGERKDNGTSKIR